MSRPGNRLTLDRADVEIVTAKMEPASPAGTVPHNRFTENKIPALLPEHCRLEGMINRRKGADGVEYGIGFALALPTGWNGRLMFQGGGAFRGERTLHRLRENLTELITGNGASVYLKAKNQGGNIDQKRIRSYSLQGWTYM